MNQSDMMAVILAMILRKKLERLENNKNKNDGINDFSKFNFTKLNHLKTNELIEDDIKQLIKRCFASSQNHTVSQ